MSLSTWTVRSAPSTLIVGLFATVRGRISCSGRLGMPDVVSRSGDSARQAAGHRATRGLEPIQLGLVGERRDGDDLPLIETRESGVDHIIGGHHGSRA